MPFDLRAELIGAVHVRSVCARMFQFCRRCGTLTSASNVLPRVWGMLVDRLDKMEIPSRGNPSTLAGLSQAKQHHLYVLLCVLVIVAGAGFRLAEFMHNRSLWMDEAAVGLSILESPLKNLFTDPGNLQCAPPLFLLTQRFIVTALGHSEQALRALLLASGLAALPLFFLVARQYLDRWSSLFALTLFALADHVILYTCEVKPYGLDVFFSLIIYIVGLPLCTNPTLRNALRLGATGIVAAWFSFTSVIVLAGFSLTSLLMQIKSRRFNAIQLIVPALMWGSSWLVMYKLQNTPAHLQYFYDYWKDYFVPSDPRLLPEWCNREIYHCLSAIGLWSFDDFARFFIAALLSVGVCVQYHKSRWRLCTLLAPMLLTLIAVGMHHYPICDRLILFLVPPAIILCCAAMGAASVPVLLRAAVAAALLLQPLATRVILCAAPRDHEEIRSACNYVRSHMLPSDTLYVYWASKFPYRYYSKFAGWSPHAIIGSYCLGMGANQELLNTDLNALAKFQRVWILLSQDSEKMPDGQPVREVIVNKLDSFGHRVDLQQYPGAEVLLYETDQD